MENMDKVKLMVQVAQMYYESGRTQQEIATQLGISRPTVSRLLTQSREEGIVHITIHNPLGYCSQLEEILRREFRLKDVLIVPHTGRQPTEVLAETAVNYLQGMLKDGDTIGVAWGKTLHHIARLLRPKSLSNVRVVQMKGGMGLTGSNIHASQIVESFSTAYRGKAYYLPVPAIVDTANVKKALMSDSSLRRTMQVAEEINVAVFSIGALNAAAAQIEAGYLTMDEMSSLQARGAVGDICSRFYTADGRLADPLLDDRTIGLELARLARLEYAVAVAGGSEKAAGILGALKGHFLNVLITDEETAARVLALAGMERPV